MKMPEGPHSDLFVCYPPKTYPNREFPKLTDAIRCSVRACLLNLYRSRPAVQQDQIPLTARASASGISSDLKVRKKENGKDKGDKRKTEEREEERDNELYFVCPRKSTGARVTLVPVVS